MILNLLVLGAFSPLSANAYEQNFQNETERIVVECRGYVDKFSIFVESFIDPKSEVKPTTNLEIGYVVKSWKPVDYEYVQETKTTGASVELEGSVSGGQGSYKMEVPWFDYLVNTSNFTTSLALKTSVVNGNIRLNCKTSLQKVRTKGTYKTDY